MPSDSNNAIQTQLSANFPPNIESMLELGCGDGDLLFTQQHKFKQAIGLDNRKKLIETAKKQAQLLGLSRIEFINQDVVEYLNDLNDGQMFDFAMVNLSLHNMPLQQALDSLKSICAHSKWVAILDYMTDETSENADSLSRMQSFKLMCKQWWAGSLDKYLDYRDAGGMDAMIVAAGQSFTHFETIDSRKELGIWLIRCEH